MIVKKKKKHSFSKSYVYVSQVYFSLVVLLSKYSKICQTVKIKSAYNEILLYTENVDPARQKEYSKVATDFPVSCL